MKSKKNESRKTKKYKVVHKKIYKLSTWQLLIMWIKKLSF